MISYSQFKDIVVNKLQRDISSNKDQNVAISSDKNQSLFIVAGPGSGKTTVMVLKILKFIFVDDVSPHEIIATTFTRKAATELHSRILDWGDEIKKYLLKIIDEMEKQNNINRIDFNQIITGTIDSIAEEILRINRDPGTNLPVVIEDFVASSAMISSGLFEKNRYLNKDLQKYLGSINGVEELKNPSKMSEVLLEIKNRLYYDQVDFNKFKDKESSPGANEALDAIKNYIEELKERNILDFPMLESRFLKWLQSGKLNKFLDEIKIILVDEYQDTNLLQEKIYFTLAESAIGNGGNITVVGDDDQSLYRFRGATVDLFTNFSKRASKQLNIDVFEVNLSSNYRSTENIINLCNKFVELDETYQTARVKEKKKIQASRPSSDLEDNEKNVPVIGMFRPNQEILAKDLSILIKNLVEGKEVKKKIKRVLRPKQDFINDDETKKDKIKNNNIKKDKIKNNETKQDKIKNNETKQCKTSNNNYKNKFIKEKISLKLDEKNGSPSDIAILTYSPKELSYGNELFPHYLRKNLNKFKTPIDVFNPRGQDLQTLKPVAIFCGLILECIDPEAKFQKSIKKIPKLAERNMNKWRRIANEYIDLSPEPHKPMSLKEFVDAWRSRTPKGPKRNEIWPETASLIQLAYKLITWINDLQDDVEGLVYLEAITKTITQTGFFNNFSAQIYFDSEHVKEKESVEEAIWNIFIPIAIGGVSIDENLLETLPNNRINIMSIHQAKGLEFPLVIIDVGSRFKKNKVKTSFLRFPKDGGKSANLEDKIRPFSTLKMDERESKDRAFDDLTRLYFVAFSRAQDVLLLVGLNSAIDGYIVDDKHKKIPNVALGWKRDEIFVGFDEIYLI